MLGIRTSAVHLNTRYTSPEQTLPVNWAFEDLVYEPSVMKPQRNRAHRQRPPTPKDPGFCYCLLAALALISIFGGIFAYFLLRQPATPSAQAPIQTDMGNTSWCLGIYTTKLSDTERWITENENALRFFQAARFIVTESEFTKILESGRASYHITEDRQLGTINGLERPASCRLTVLEGRGRALAFFVLAADIQYSSLWQKACGAAGAWQLEAVGCEYYWKTDADVLLAPAALARLSLLLPPRPVNSSFCHNLAPLPPAANASHNGSSGELARRAKNKAPTYQFNNGPVVPCSFYIGRIWYKRIWLASGSFYGYSAGLLPRLAAGATLPSRVSEEADSLDLTPDVWTALHVESGAHNFVDLARLYFGANFPGRLQPGTCQWLEFHTRAWLLSLAPPARPQNRYISPSLTARKPSEQLLVRPGEAVGSDQIEPENNRSRAVRACVKSAAWGLKKKGSTCRLGQCPPAQHLWIIN